MPSQLGEIAVGKSSWLRSSALSLTEQSLPAASSSSTAKKSKGKGRADGEDHPRKKSLFGVAAFANTLVDQNEAGPSTVRVEVPAPTIHEGVVFKPLAQPTPLQVELREMVAGRNPLNEAKKAIAIDCEMVGLGALGAESALARVSLVNYHGHVVLDTFVAPRERVTDWRTWVSGVREEDILGAPSFEEVQKKVAGLVEGRVLVGHAIENDLKALLLNHPGPMVRDTQKCKILRERAKTKRPGLKKLAESELGLEIQKGSHSSVTDARATMALYRLHKNEWEKQLRPATEAYKVKIAKSGKHTKRKRDEAEDDQEDDDDEVFASSKRGKKGSGRPEFPGGGQKGISSGLGLIIKKNGVRIDQRTGKVLGEKRRGPRDRAAEDVPADTGGSNWWDE